MPTKSKNSRKQSHKTVTRKASNTRKRPVVRRRKSLFHRFLGDSRGYIRSGKVKKLKFGKNRFTPLTVIVIVGLVGVSVFAYSLSSSSVSLSINGVSSGVTFTSPIKVSATPHNAVPINVTFYLDGSHFSLTTNSPFCMFGKKGETCKSYTISNGSHTIKAVMDFKVTRGSKHHQKTIISTYTTSVSFTVAPPTTTTTGSGSSTGTSDSTPTTGSTTTGSGSSSTGSTHPVTGSSSSTPTGSTGSTTTNLQSVLGAYAGSTNVSGINALGTQLGFHLNYAMDFLDGTSWSTITSSLNNWILAPWQATTYKMIWGVDMLPNSGSSIAQGSTGAYNSYFKTVAQQLVSGGQASSIIRLGWEFNGSWFPWQVQSIDSSTTQSQFIAYWQNIVNSMRSISGQHFTFEWNPTEQIGSTPVLADYYPGDAYVDYIGLDIYANTPDSTETPQQQWTRIDSTDDYALPWLASFSSQHGKPIVLPEWGIWNDGASDGTGDNAYFIQQMAAWIQSHNVAEANYWQYGTSALFGGQSPNASAAFKAAF